MPCMLSFNLSHVIFPLRIHGSFPGFVLRQPSCGGRFRLGLGNSGSEWNYARFIIFSFLFWISDFKTMKKYHPHPFSSKINQGYGRLLPNCNKVDNQPLATPPFWDSLFGHSDASISRKNSCLVTKRLEQHLFSSAFLVIPHHPLTSCFVMSAHPQMQLRLDTSHRLANAFQLSAYD